MAQNMKNNNRKKLFKQALATYTPGMSRYQLATALQISTHQARQLLYTVRNLAIGESN
ncbi:MAG TPA: hypothetical protein VFV38_08740 [Ktedonobacteraceae bacterium]|nr:hypothetical protein [Ktedonobacteraceae bacterium]